jgi:hypothetical protein
VPFPPVLLGRRLQIGNGGLGVLDILLNLFPQPGGCRAGSRLYFRLHLSPSGLEVGGAPFQLGGFFAPLTLLGSHFFSLVSRLFVSAIRLDSRAGVAANRCQHCRDRNACE